MSFASYTGTDIRLKNIVPAMSESVSGAENTAEQKSTEDCEVSSTIATAPEPTPDSFQTPFDATPIESEPFTKETVAAKTPEPEKPLFTKINIQNDDGATIDRATSIVSYIGDSVSLLQNAANEERNLKVTLPLSAFGLCNEVFTNACDEHNHLVLEAESVDGDPQLYELVYVDDGAYLSCMSSSLDEEYLHAVIVAAREHLLTTKEYCHQMVGYRGFSRPGEEGKQYIKTLCLNSFEMSSLQAALESMCESVNYEVIKNESGATCLRFTAR